MSENGRVRWNQHEQRENEASKGGEGKAKERLSVLSRNGSLWEIIFAADAEPIEGGRLLHLLAGKVVPHERYHPSSRVNYH